MVLVAVLWMLFARYPERGNIKKDKIVYFVFCGFLVGTLAGLLGIAGGVLMVPLLIIILGFDVYKAVGTSSAVLIFSS